MDGWTYGVSISREGSDHVVHVRDIPQIVTAGDTPAEALSLAADAIEVSILHLMERNSPLPAASAVLDGEYPVGLPARLAAKASVYEAWRETGLSKSELARRMGRNEIEIRRILDPAHGTKLDQLDEAAKALGRRLVVGLVPSA